MMLDTAQTGAQLRDAGMQIALDFAGPDWSETALATLKRWLTIAPDEFTMEQFRAQSIVAGMASPRSHHAWGALANLAAKRGLIVWTGRYVQAKSARTHCHPVRLWKRRVAARTTEGT